MTDICQRALTERSVDFTHQSPTHQHNAYSSLQHLSCSVCLYRLSVSVFASHFLNPKSHTDCLVIRGPTLFRLLLQVVLCHVR